MKPEELTKYEKSRVLGARALQIAMNAPLLIKISQEDLEKIKFDSLKIAETELESGILPISVDRPMPNRKEDKLRRVRERKISDESIEEKEIKEEEEIAKEGEIMSLAVSDDDEFGEESGGEETGVEE